MRKWYVGNPDALLYYGDIEGKTQEKVSKS